MNPSFETEGRMDADKFGNGELRELRSYQYPVSSVLGKTALISRLSYRGLLNQGTDTCCCCRGKQTLMPDCQGGHQHTQ